MNKKTGFILKRLVTKKKIERNKTVTILKRHRRLEEWKNWGQQLKQSKKEMEPSWRQKWSELATRMSRAYLLSHLNSVPRVLSGDAKKPMELWKKQWNQVGDIIGRNWRLKRPELIYWPAWIASHQYYAQTGMFEKENRKILKIITLELLGGGSIC